MSAGPTPAGALAGDHLLPAKGSRSGNFLDLPLRASSTVVLERLHDSISISVIPRSGLPPTSDGGPIDHAAANQDEMASRKEIKSRAMQEMLMMSLQQLWREFKSEGPAFESISWAMILYRIFSSARHSLHLNPGPLVASTHPSFNPLAPKSASKRKAARNEGLIVPQAAPDMAALPSSIMGSIIVKTRSALQTTLLQDIEALGFDSKGNEERVIGALGSVVALLCRERKLSYHNPLIWISSNNSSSSRAGPFSIEAGWLACEQFADIVKAGLEIGNPSSWAGLSPLSRWMKLWKPLRRTILRWNKFQRASRAKHRVETEDRLNSLCTKADLGSIADSEVVEIKDLKATLDRIYTETSTYWQQRAKRRWLKDRDRNTRYFHLWASHRWKINWISSLQVHGRIVHDQTTSASSLRDFYIGLLGREIQPLLNIKWDSLFGSPSVDISSLDDPFTMIEVYEVIKADRHTLSSVWKGICSLLDIFGVSLSFRPGEVSSFRFWLDPWVCGDRLCSKYPSLFSTTMNPDISIEMAKQRSASNEVLGWSL
ncbi:hypothetical protein Cni_G29454 [Canna indica]|uniref:Uncharacterized protein n=1 Tax=Canna indica TaxID=4628 RepID=A0AAQ3L571_9LILI|nr:hypothetical protein Cni_G29454 [Canna indica]